MKTASLIGILALVLAGGVSALAQKPDFSGSWTMDRARSFGLPGNMNQTMVVTQNGDQIEVETRLIQPDNERTVKDTYVLDGKEREFTPQAPPGQTPPKGKRTSNWMPAGNGILVTEVTTSETPKGPVTSQVVRKWTISNGELVIAMYVDSPNASYEAKRIFIRKELSRSVKKELSADYTDIQSQADKDGWKTKRIISQPHVLSALAL